MTGSAYARGNAFERRVATHLRDQGYLVWQTRGSKSLADLLAFKPRQVLFVQVKGGATTLTHGEWNGLLGMAEHVGGVAVVADRNRRAIRYRRITGTHPAGSRTWPCEEFLPDELATRQEFA